jgi:hypothetical protein
MNPPIVIPPDIQAKAAEKQKQQQAEDAVGMKAATATLPGPMKGIWSVVPEIPVGPFLVRRFKDGDLKDLAAIGHPFDSVQVIVNGGYKFIPTGQDCWTLCFLMTRPRKEFKQLLVEKGVEGIKEAAEDIFAEFGVYALGELQEAILKQFTIYGQGQIEYEAKKTEGEQSDPPPSSPQ